MNSSLVNALAEAENKPSGGYRPSILCSPAPTRGRRRTKKIRELVETINETVEIIDDDSNSSCGSKPSPEKKSPRSRAGRTKNALTLESPPGSSGRDSLGGVPTDASTPDLSESSPTNRGRGASRRSRGRGSRGRGAGRGAAQLEALQPKKLRGTACGATLIGIQRGRGARKQDEVQALNTELYRGRRWQYASTPTKVEINTSSTNVTPERPLPVETPLGGNGTPQSSPLASSDCDMFSTDSGTVNISTSEKDGSDTSVILSHPVRRRRPSKKQNCTSSSESPNSSPSSGPSEGISPTIRKTTDSKNTEAEEWTSNKKFKSFHQEELESQTRAAAKSRNQLKLPAASDGQPSIKSNTLLPNTRGLVTELSKPSKQSLAALEPNMKGVTRVYTPATKGTKAGSAASEAVEVIEADSTIEVPSDDESKGGRGETSSKTGAEPVSNDEINFISDKPDEDKNEAKQTAKPTQALCSVCGTWSNSLSSCLRCHRSFDKFKPKKLKYQALAKGDQVCSKCGGVFPQNCRPSRPKGLNDSDETFICRACQKNCVTRSDSKKDCSYGPGATFKTKDFYTKKLQDFAVGQHMSPAAAIATAAIKRLAISSRSSGLPNKRNKGRTKPEPECISLIDSDEEEAAPFRVQTSGETRPSQESVTTARSNTRKSKMKNEDGETVASTANGTVLITTVRASALSTALNLNNSHPCDSAEQKPAQGATVQNVYPEWEEASSTLTINLVLLAFGSKRFVQDPPSAVISPEGIKFLFTSQSHGFGTIHLKAGEMEEFHYSLAHTLPTFFVRALPCFALRVRSRMNMKRPENYDPHSREIYETMLFFRPLNMTFTKEVAGHMNSIITIMKDKRPDVCKKITTAEVNEYLKLYTPPQTLEELQSQALSPRHSKQPLPRDTKPPQVIKSPLNPAKKQKTSAKIEVDATTSPSKPVVTTLTLVTPSTTGAGLQPVGVVPCLASTVVQKILLPTQRVMPTQGIVPTGVSSSPVNNTYVIVPRVVGNQTSHVIVTIPPTPPVSQVTPKTVQSTPKTVQSITPTVITTRKILQSSISESPQRVLTYPPPPAMGGVTINSADLECLADGEFLNDVIIEFYLRYLMEAQLSSHDRRRTHIFSSFFYKRLTQREYGPRSGDQGKELTPQEKRHDRVKKWTRRVDLFEKDFIVIPINESSHWYVAIVCFPSRVRNSQTPLDQSEETNQSEGSQSEEELLSVSLGGPVLENGPETDAAQRIEDVQNGSESQQCDGVTSSADIQGDADVTSTVTTSAAGEGPVGVNSDEGQSSHRGHGSSEGEGSSEGQDSESAINREGQSSAATPTDASDDKEYQLHHGIKNEVPCILIMDSLKSSPKRHVMQKLREYLEIEWRVRKSEARRFTARNMKGSQLDVPQQSNFSDCGVFILQYVEQFFKKPIRNFRTPIKGLSKWFPESEVKAKRAAITKLIHDLKAQQEKKNSDR